MVTKGLLAIGALVAAFIAISSFLDPETALSDFGITVSDPNGRNEIRAQYGGFFAAASLVLALCFLGRIDERFGLGVLLVTAGGVLSGRIVSLIVEGPAVFAEYTWQLQLFHGVDLTLTVLAALALWRGAAQGLR